MTRSPTRTPEQAEALFQREQKARRLADEGAAAMSEHQASAKAVEEKTARLKASRLAKEAADAEQARSTPPNQKPKARR